MTKSKFIIVALLSLSLALISCGNNNKTNSSSETEQSSKQGKEYTSAYVCPMHCEGSGSTEAGTCPVCNMDYVKNDDHKEDDHQH